MGSGCIWMVAGAELTEKPLSVAVSGDWLSFPLGTQGTDRESIAGYMGPSLPRSYEAGWQKGCWGPSVPVVPRILLDSLICSESFE